MKILYVNPSRLESGMDAIIIDPPLSLISLAAMVPDHDARLYDFKIEKHGDKKVRRELNRSDVVAITSMTPQIFNAFDVAEMAKEQGCTTVIGGYHPTLAPDYVAKHDAIDYAVRGEGEHTFKELIDFLDKNNNKLNLKDIDGLSYKNNNGQIIHNKDRQLEPNLDNFPLPRRDLLRSKVYMNLGARITTLETSRGCPHNCKFCCIIKMWKDPTQHITYRTKSIKRIMQEIYACDWRNNFIFFCEDNFTINVKRTKKILETIIRSGVNNKILFSCQSRVDTLYRNPWLIDLLEKANFRQVFLGIESVHQQSLDAMNKKNTTPQMVQKVVTMLRNRGISVFGGMIIGFPGETVTMVRQNIQFAKSLDMDCVQFTPITAFPGTEFFDEMKSKGMVETNNYKYYNLFYPMMHTDQLTFIDMWKLVAEAYASYYFDGDWIMARAKEYLNPFGKFNWMFTSLHRLVKQGLKGGAGMLHNEGITHRIISEELKQMKKHSKKKGITDLLIPTSLKLPLQG
jgi:anaerobic magnesium-protoporphyrin IX monomethyl ester cyclase